MKNNTNIDQTEVAVMESKQLAEDVKHSILIVSLLANMFVLVGWVALQVTSQYDFQVATFLFYRW